MPNEGPPPTRTEPTLKTIALQYYVPPIIAGLILVILVPWANHYFETRRLRAERQMRVLESTAETFAGVVAHIGKVRELERAVSTARADRDRLRADRSKSAEFNRLNEYIDRRTRELRETETTLYGLSQQLRGQLFLTRLLFGEESRKTAEEFQEWWRKQTEPIEAPDLAPYMTKLLEAMVKEIRE